MSQFTVTITLKPERLFLPCNAVSFNYVNIIVLVHDDEGVNTCTVIEIIAFGLGENGGE